LSGKKAMLEVTFVYERKDKKPVGEEFIGDG